MSTPEENLAAIEHARCVRLAARRIGRDAAILGITTHTADIKASCDDAARVDLENRVELMQSVMLANGAQSPAWKLEMIARMASVKSPSYVRHAVRMAGLSVLTD